MKSFLIFNSLLAATVSLNAATTFSDVSLTQDSASGTVAVSYATAGDPAIVTCEFLTNGVSLGEADFTRLHGDVNVKVSAGAHSVTWATAAERVTIAGTLSVKLKAWSPSTPPDYMVVDLVIPNSPVHYYVSTNALPVGGLANDVYRRHKIVMRRIPAKGVTFTMGSASNESGRNADRETRHEVTFTHDYWLGIYPLTSRQYANIIGTQPLWGYWTTNNVNDTRFVTEKMRDMRPQTNLSISSLRGTTYYTAANGGPGKDTYAWPQNGYDVLSTELIGRARTRTGVQFDLPTDAQWEFACRAGTSTPYFFGNTMVTNGGWTQANTWPDGVRSPHPVGETLANAYGLYDLYGNVLETCRDRMETGSGQPGYTMPETAVTDPSGPEFSSTRNVVQRGGAYNWANSQSRSGYRERCDFTWKGNERGVRLWAPID